MHVLVEHTHTPFVRGKKRTSRVRLVRHTSPKRKRSASELKKRMQDEHKDDVQETLVDIVQSLRLCKDQVFEMIEAGGLNDVFEKRLTFVRGTDTMCDDESTANHRCSNITMRSDPVIPSSIIKKDSKSEMKKQIIIKKTLIEKEDLIYEDAYDSSMLPDKDSEQVPELDEETFANILREVEALGRGPGCVGNEQTDQWKYEEDPRVGIGPSMDHSHCMIGMHQQLKPHPSIKQKKRVQPMKISTVTKKKRRVCPTLISTQSDHTQPSSIHTTKPKRRVVPTVITEDIHSSSINNTSQISIDRDGLGVTKPKRKKSAARTKADVKSEVMQKKKKPMKTSTSDESIPSKGRKIDRVGQSQSQYSGIYALAMTDTRMDRSHETGKLSALREEQRARKKSKKRTINDRQSPEPVQSNRRSHSVDFRTPPKRRKRDSHCKSTVIGRSYSAQQHRTRHHHYHHHRSRTKDSGRLASSSSSLFDLSLSHCE